MFIISHEVLTWDPVRDQAGLEVRVHTARILMNVCMNFSQMKTLVYPQDPSNLVYTTTLYRNRDTKAKANLTSTRHQWRMEHLLATIESRTRRS